MATKAYQMLQGRSFQGDLFSFPGTDSRSLLHATLDRFQRKLVAPLPVPDACQQKVGRKVVRKHVASRECFPLGGDRVAHHQMGMGGAQPDVTIGEPAFGQIQISQPVSRIPIMHECRPDMEMEFTLRGEPVQSLPISYQGLRPVPDGGMILSLLPVPVPGITLPLTERDSHERDSGDTQHNRC